jgi:hypothetical protein
MAMSGHGPGHARMARRSHAQDGLWVLWTDYAGSVTIGPVKPEARHLRLLPQSDDAAVVRAAFRELHDLAAPEQEASTALRADPAHRRWHPSMGASLAATR